MNIDKPRLLKEIQSQLEAQVLTAKKAALQAHSAATSKESIAEHKYDTFGLEASYLAHGQSARVEQAEVALHEFRSWAPADLSDSQTVKLGALIRMESCHPPEQTRYFFISKLAGGLRVTLAQIDVLVVSPNSPVAKTLLGKERGEECRLLLAGDPVDFFVDDFC